MAATRANLPENLVVKVDQEGPDDVAGKHLIDDLHRLIFFLASGADS